ncbi:cysteine hydrolase family protein [Roseateles amylovorans]|uniref:Cysteine hydrolase n=1 Tax=Roseateles amylovorans TaxID=2978473 RepID=A0ABY6BAH0_9BURK|nr:isochorismatase family cysteine hydrolase [Roseateles amylovorans]UXH80570.1 cysteine hydrolase [Roseateles amylovorans]
MTSARPSGHGRTSTGRTSEDRAARRSAVTRTPEDALPGSRRVLLLVDFINPLQFHGAEDLAQDALEAARAAAAFKKRFCADGSRAIYVNDNFGQWRSDFRTLLRECRRQGGAAAQLARRLAPAQQDLMVLKPRHSGFHATPLELLLKTLGARELVVTGLATDYCVMCTAMDAYVRGYKVWVPEDCTAAESPRRKHEALSWMQEALKARVSPAHP